MTTTLANTAATFHALTGTQPVGQTQIAAMADWAGTLTSVKRCNETYWVVVTRSVVGAFTDRPQAGASAAIWQDALTGQYVIDYWDGGDSIEVSRTRGLKAAIGVAAWSTAVRWVAQH